MCPLEDDGADDDAEKLEAGGEEEVEVGGGGVVSLLTPSAVGGCMGTVVTGSDSRFMYKPPLPVAVMSLVM
jgi:hypothetical protein